MTEDLYHSKETTADQITRLCELLQASQFENTEDVRDRLKYIREGENVSDLIPIMRLLDGAFSMCLRPEDKDQPLKAVLQMETWRTPEPGDYSDDDLRVIGEVLATTADPVTVARLGDILWIMKRDGVAARKALDAYLQSAERHLLNLENDNWVHGKNAFHRAIQLWRALGHDPVIKKALVQIGESAVDIPSPEPKSYHRVRVMRLISEFGLCEEPSRWVALIDNLAEEAKGRGHYERARDYWDCCISLSRFTGDKDARARFLGKQADCWVEEARILNHEGNSAMNIRELFAEAIEACRRAGGRRELIDQLHKEMIEVQERALDEMYEFRQEIDLTEYVDAGKKAATLEALDDALISVASFATPSTKEELRRRAKEHMESSPLWAVISRISYDERGRAQAIKPSGITDREAEFTVVAEMCREACLHIELLSKSALEAARRELDRRVAYGSDLFHRLLAMNPFVPEGRERLFEQGLIAGLRGDWSSCAHILIPQIENSIRVITEQSGLLVTFLAKDTTQNELDLNKLLYREELEEIFGEDMVFFLRVLLVEKLGFNLRNRVCHGLVSSNGLGANSGEIGRLIHSKAAT